MAQINIYVRRTDREQFASYAAELGLDVTALSNLLLTRELRIRRLYGLESYGVTEPRDAKITAHLSKDRQAAFVDRAKDCGMSVSQAGAILVMSELTNRWLEKAVDN